MLREFCRHWTEHNEPVHHNTKLAWEKEKTFNLKSRWEKWQSNQKKWGTPKYKKEGLSRPFPLYFDKKFGAKLKPAEYQEYKIHLQKLGFLFGSGHGGQWVKPPNAERIWIT